MQAGTLRHRVAIQCLDPGAATTRDEHGGISETWLTLMTVWASIEPIRAIEMYRADQVDARVTHRVTMRWQTGLNSSMRLLFGTRVLLILTILNPEERREMLEMLAMEAV